MSSLFFPTDSPPGASGAPPRRYRTMDLQSPPAASGTGTGPGAPDRIRYDRRGVLWNGETVHPARVLPAPAVSGAGRAGHR